MEMTLESVILGVVLAICLVLLVRHLKRLFAPSASTGGCQGCTVAEDCESRSENGPPVYLEGASQQSGCELAKRPPERQQGQ